MKCANETVTIELKNGTVQPATRTACWCLANIIIIITQLQIPSAARTKTSRTRAPLLLTTPPKQAPSLTAPSRP